MTEDETESAAPIQRLRDDLQRPAGGWTVGLVSICGTMAVFLTGRLGLWPLPEWTATIVGFVLFAIHIGWGAHGYYPRGM